jgi:hypothetical protein
MTTAIRIGPWEGVLPQLRDVGNVGHARFNVRVNTRREGLPPLEGGWTVVVLDDGTRLEGSTVLLSAERRRLESTRPGPVHGWDLQLAWRHGPTVTPDAAGCVPGA